MQISPHTPFWCSHGIEDTLPNDLATRQKHTSGIDSQYTGPLPTRMALHPIDDNTDPYLLLSHLDGANEAPIVFPMPGSVEQETHHEPQVFSDVTQTAPKFSSLSLVGGAIIWEDPSESLRAALFRRPTLTR